MVSGGPLSNKIGDKLVAAGVRLYTMYGSTELASIAKILDASVPRLGRQPSLSKDRQEWAWMAFADHIQHRMVSQGNDLYELQVLVSVTLATTRREP